MTRDLWRHEDMILYSNRLKSLEDWPIDFIVKTEVARSGFYFTAYKNHDAVECFVCNIGIGNWEVNDDPHSEHSRLSPNCDYYTRMDYQFIYSPKHPQYRSIHSRFLSFREWPMSLAQKPIDLINAGFFYKNTGDVVGCYYCDITLNQWRVDDDPWKEHAYNTQECHFLNIIKGEGYVEQIKRDHKPIFTEPLVVQEMVEAPDSIAVSDLCTICMAAVKNICFIPCGHLAACARCSLSSNQCPICRRTYTDAIRMNNNMEIVQNNAENEPSHQ